MPDPRVLTRPLDPALRRQSPRPQAPRDRILPQLPHLRLVLILPVQPAGRDRPRLRSAGS